MPETVEQMTERVIREEVQRKLNQQDFGLTGRMWTIKDLQQWLGVSLDELREKED